jgi:WhiB family transcriptional regulator, redox-sensing transcriptional regulator
VSKLSAVSQPAEAVDSMAGRQTSDDFPGIDHPPAGEDFDAFVRREASLPSAPAVALGDYTSPPPLLQLSEEDEELSWQERALCAQTDPEAFFPEKGGSTREAKKVCVSCEVRAECLEYALAHDERFGIWGGLSERERRRLKKQAG